MKFINLSFFLGIILIISSCASYKEYAYITEEFEIPSQVYRHSYAKTWQAISKVVQRFDLAIQNQEAGVIKTRWQDNTLEVNFADSFGGKDSVKAAKFKLVFNIVKGFRGNKEVTKVTIFKRQLVEQDFLQGMKVIRSDGILEKSLLYRIDRVLAVEDKLKAIEDAKNKELEASF
ncbi:MAG: hypothetical protein ACPGJV_05100 [Bacteriovoracaceae bacterium]